MLFSAWHRMPGHRERLSSNRRARRMARSAISNAAAIPAAKTLGWTAVNNAPEQHFLDQGGDGTSEQEKPQQGERFVSIGGDEFGAVGERLLPDTRRRVNYCRRCDPYEGQEPADSQERRIAAAHADRFPAASGRLRRDEPTRHQNDGIGESVRGQAQGRGIERYGGARLRKPGEAKVTGCQSNGANRQDAQHLRAGYGG